MPFNNPVVGGETLVIPSIRSANYVPGVSGWAIFRNGDSEFASGTFRGPVVIISPITGEVLASIGATGNGSFQRVSVNEDVVIGTQSVVTSLLQRSKGIVGRFHTTGTLGNSGANGAFTDVCWAPWYLDSTRLYRIHNTSLRATNGNLSNNQDLVNRLTVAQPGGLNAQIHENRQGCAGGESVGVNLSQYLATTATGPATVKWSASSTDTNPFTFHNTNGFSLVIEDVGPKFTTSGGTGTPPSGGDVFIKTYQCTASKSYQENGNPITTPDTDNNIYFSDFGTRGYGNERSIAIFPGSTIRTDLAGATILSAKLYLYCFTAYETTGTLVYRSEPNTSIPATYNPGSSAFYWNYANAWPLPGWHFVSMLDIGSGGRFMLDEILTNGMNAIGLPPILFGLDATGFRGFGFHADYRPYMEITYEV